MPLRWRYVARIIRIHSPISIGGKGYHDFAGERRLLPVSPLRSPRLSIGPPSHDQSRASGPHRWHCEPSHPLSDSASTRSTLPAPSTTSVGERLSSTKCIVVALHLNTRLVRCILLGSFVSVLMPCLHRLDTSYVAVWVCRFPYINVGRLNSIPYR